MVEKTHYDSRPSGKVVVAWIVTRLLVLLLFYGLVSVLFFFRSGMSFSNLFGSTGLMILFLLIGLSFVYQIFLLKTYSYKITDKGIYFKGGIIVRRQKFVPFFKVTNVETTQNIVEQMLGISALGFQTAGTGGQPFPEIVFEGVEDVEKPRQLVYRLMEKVKSR